jgi:UDP-2,3-diacylglucosamine hydrolase
VVILGDLFEVWPGDDCLRGLQPTADAKNTGLAALCAADEGGTGHDAGHAAGEATANRAPAFAEACAQMLHAASRQRPIYFLHGNRDFLLGEAFAAATGAQRLADPALLVFGPRRVLLSHGDALCLDDVDYQRFRAQVRNPAWIETLLRRPLAEREALARDLRAQSEARHRQQPTYADADTQMARQWLRQAGAETLVHGPTHRPAEHDLGDGLVRRVLSDWDAGAQPPRAEVLRLDREGQFKRLRLADSGA